MSRRRPRTKRARPKPAATVATGETVETASYEDLRSRLDVHQARAREIANLPVPATAEARTATLSELRGHVRQARPLQEELGRRASAFERSHGERARRIWSRRSHEQREKETEMARLLDRLLASPKPKPRPDPRGASIAAAVVGELVADFDEWLGGGPAQMPCLRGSHVGLFAVMCGLLAQTGRAEIVWEEERGLRRGRQISEPDVRGTFKQLAANGLVTLRVEAGNSRVGYGPRTRASNVAQSYANQCTMPPFVQRPADHANRPCLSTVTRR